MWIWERCSFEQGGGWVQAQTGSEYMALVSCKQPKTLVGVCYAQCCISILRISAIRKLQQLVYFLHKHIFRPKLYLAW